MSIDLTIVLVTQPSRIAYFREALERIKETLLFQQSIDLLVIFNGKSPLGERYLDTFEVQFQGRISKEIILKNSPMPRDIWNCIRKRKLRWIHMPGDDDLIIHKSYQ